MLNLFQHLSVIVLFMPHKIGKILKMTELIIYPFIFPPVFAFLQISLFIEIAANRSKSTIMSYE